MFRLTQPARMLIRKSIMLSLILFSSPVIAAPAQAAAVVVDCEPAVTVISDADSGPGSLRQAIVDVCDAGIITFDLPMPATITLTSGQLTNDL